MKNNVDFNIDEILDNVSMSSPEADGFHFLINEKKYAKAEKFLHDFLSKEESKFVVNHFKKENEQNVKLVEIKKSAMVEHKTYVVRIGKNISSGYKVIYSGKSKVFSNGNCNELKAVSQVWDIVNITE